MKAKLTLIPVAAVVGLGTYVVFHPGRAYAEPRMPKIAAPSAFQQGGTFTLDPAHTSVGFEIGHLGISKVQGRFTKFTGKVRENAADLSQSGVEFTAQIDSIDTAVAPRDAHLKSPDFFDAAKYPELTFKSTRVRKARGGYVADGALTIKGVTKPVSISFKHYGPITDPWGNSRVGVVAEPITINRQDYGIAYNDKLKDGTPSVANEVTVRISLEATLDKPAEK
jgi:polyisoprenoid-binding protein YceI